MTLLSSVDCWLKYGDPLKEKHMTMIKLPLEVRQKVKLARLYCGEDFAEPLLQAFQNLVDRKLVEELKSIDGCFNVRRKTESASMSLHSWGVAIDVNAKDNAYGKKPKLSKEFVACFTDAGMNWGGVWRVPDGMHFQLKR